MARALSLDLRERVIAAHSGWCLMQTGGGAVRRGEGERDPLARALPG